MEIRDADSDRFVRLEPVAYEFPDLVGVEYDSDWLIIRGRARSDAEEWTFQDASLLVAEAQAFGSWIRDAAQGSAPVIVADDEGRTWPTTEAIEPNLGLGVVRYDADAVTVRVFLRLESAPPSSRRGAEPDMQSFIDLTTPRSSLERAADEWHRALVKFPKRS